MNTVVVWRLLSSVRRDAEVAPTIVFTGSH